MQVSSSSRVRHFHIIPARGKGAPWFGRHVSFPEGRHVFPPRGRSAPTFRRCVSFPERRHAWAAVPVIRLSYARVVSVAPPVVPVVHVAPNSPRTPPVAPILVAILVHVFAPAVLDLARLLAALVAIVMVVLAPAVSASFEVLVLSEGSAPDLPLACGAIDLGRIATMGPLHAAWAAAP